MPNHYRALFISDVHLGTRGAQARMLLDFLAEARADTIYLVGDIIDFWRIRRGLVWREAHGEVLKAILAKVRQGSRVVFIPGNHDDGLRAYCGTRFGDIEIERSAVHTTAAGRRYLVIHGDEYDVVISNARWLALLGDRSYALALAINFHTLVLDGIPRLSPENFDQARRFITLIDTLYDHRVKLFASAADMPDRLYMRGENAKMFERTASRLEEMQSQDWLELAHLT